MRVLVTGASGFVGSHLVELLLQDGSFEVQVLVRRTSNLRWLEGRPVERKVGDVTQSEEELRPLLQGIDVVFHVAGLTKALRKQTLYEVNQGGTARLLRACTALQSPPGRVVLVSSAGAQGPSPGDTPLTERMASRPVDEYGRSKLAAEGEAERVRDRVPWVILRPGAIYGPRDLEMLPIFQAIRRGWLARIGLRPSLANFCHVRDVAQACVCAARAGEAAVGQAFLVGGPNATTLEFGEAVARALDRKRLVRVMLPRPLFRAAGLASSLVEALTRKPRIFTWGNLPRLLARNWALDISKARHLLGYEPRFDLDKGTQDTVAWYREQELLQF